MQEKIKELINMWPEVSQKKYTQLLKDLYNMPVLYTVLHKNCCDFSQGYGTPVTVSLADGQVALRIFTEHQLAVDFCNSRPNEYMQNNVPLIAKLEKSKNDYNYIFSIAPNMKVNRLWLDDVNTAQPFNCSLRDMIKVNQIDTRISCLTPAGTKPEYLQFNREYIMPV